MGKIFYILLLSFSFLNAQKIVKKSILNGTVSLIQINAHNCFKVDISTAAVDEMVIEAEIEGEYAKDLLLAIKEEGNTLLVSAGFQPNFRNPNDKLSAHKIISIILKITLPKYKKVELYGSSSNVFVTGEYEHLKITLGGGRCVLKDAGETVEVATQSGDIKVIDSDAVISARTKYGKIFRPIPSKGEANFILTTITGNIDLRKTE